MSNDFKLHFFIFGILKENQDTHTLERDWLVGQGGVAPFSLPFSLLSFAPTSLLFVTVSPCSIHHPSLPAFSSLSKACGENICSE